MKPETDVSSRLIYNTLHSKEIFLKFWAILLDLWKSRAQFVRSTEISTFGM